MKNYKIFKLIYAILPLLCIGTVSCIDETEEPWRGTVVTSFEPMTAKARDTITIYGKNFKPINSNTVIFSDNRIAQVVEWSTTELRAVVPDSGVVNGPIKVRVGIDEIAVSKQSFTIDESQPVILSISPDHGLPGEIITIKAVNIAKDVQSNRVLFDGKEAQIVKQEGITMKVILPNEVSDGEVDVVVESNGNASGPQKFDVGIIFKDNFNRSEALGGDWKIDKGDWSITNQYVINKGGGAVYYNVGNATLTVGNGHSFRLSTDIRIDVAAGSCFAGIIFNAQDENQFYLLRISGEGLVQLLATNDSGANWPGVFYNAPVATSGPDFYHVEIFSDTPGNFQIKISQKDKILFEQKISDPEARFNNGQAGLWSLDDHSQFDNFYMILK